MKKDAYRRRIDEIVKSLNELFESDMAIVQPRSSVPVLIDVKELSAYGERFEQREKLHAELAKLASEPIEN